MGKTIAGRSSLDGRFEGDDVVDIIFENENVATFICRKLYETFIYSNPEAVDEAFVRELADVFRTNGYVVEPVLRHLFTSEFFYDDAWIGAMIKSPAVLVAGLARQLGNDPGDARLVQDMQSIEQNLMDTPTVRGWVDYRTWISTTTYPLRKSIAERFVTGLFPGEPSQSPMDVIGWAKTIDDYSDAQKLVDNATFLLIPQAIS
jgi:uncharacterized protein (DUF1800 family)